MDAPLCPNSRLDACKRRRLGGMRQHSTCKEKFMITDRASQGFRDCFLRKYIKKKTPLGYRKTQYLRKQRISRVQPGA